MTRSVPWLQRPIAFALLIAPSRDSSFVPAILPLRHRLLANMIHTDSTTDSRDFRSGRRVRRLWFRLLPAVVAAVVFLVGASVAVWAQRSRGVEVENMRVGFDASFSSLKASNSFKIGTWTPVWVQLRGGSEPWSGFMELSVADDDGTPTAFRMPVAVGANQSERFTAYARPGSRQPEFTIRLLDQEWPAGRWSVARHGHAASSRVDHAERNADPDHGAAAGSGDRSRICPASSRRGSGVCSQRRGRDRDGTYRPSDRLDARPLVRL